VTTPNYVKKKIDMTWKEKRKIWCGFEKKNVKILWDDYTRNKSMS